MTTTPSSGSFLLLFKTSSMSEVVEPRRIGDQDLSTGGFVGNAFVQQTKQIPEIGNRLGAVADMRPIAAPHHLIGCSLDNGAHVGRRVRIGPADARIAVCARNLG